MNQPPYTTGKCYVDNKCDGCQGCLLPSSVCPWGAISFDTTTNTATIDQTKCLGYADCAALNGGMTFCESACPDPNSASLTATLAIVRA